MNAPVIAVLLAAAVAVAPPPPRRRLGVNGNAQVRRRQVLALTVLLAAVSAAVAAAVLGSPVAAGAAVPAVATGWIRHRRTVRRRRGRLEGRAIASALEVLVGELRVGAHPVGAFAAAAAEADGRVAEALRSAAARARLGADVAAGLRSAGRRSAVPLYWDRIAVCWQLAAEHGLAMSGLMGAAHRDILDRRAFTDRVEAGLAGARATAATLAGLPLLGVILGELIGAHPVRFLLGGGAGSWLLVIGVAVVCAGVMWSDRIIAGLAE